MRSPGTMGLSRHTDTLHPRTRTSAGTDSKAQDTMSSTNTSSAETIPMALRRGDAQQLSLRLGASLTNELAADFRLVFPDNN